MRRRRTRATGCPNRVATSRRAQRSRAARPRASRRRYRQSRAPALAKRAVTIRAAGEEHGDRIISQPAQRERQHARRRAIEPLLIIDRDQQRRSGRHPSQNAQRPPARAPADLPQAARPPDTAPLTPRSVGGLAALQARHPTGSRTSRPTPRTPDPDLAPRVPSRSPPHRHHERAPASGATASTCRSRPLPRAQVRPASRQVQRATARAAFAPLPVRAPPSAPVPAAMVPATITQTLASTSEL